MSKTTKIFLSIAAAIVVITVLVLVFFKTKTTATTKTTTTPGTETGKATTPTNSNNRNIEDYPDDIVAAAQAVLRGEYGNMPERKTLLEADGYNYEEVQAVVNLLLSE